MKDNKMEHQMTAHEYRQKFTDQDEHNIQKGFIDWFDLQYTGLLLYAVPNGGKRDKATAGKMKAEGVRRGIPDLHLPYVKPDCPGLYIETKTPTGKLSPEQIICHAYLRAQGYEVAVVRNLEEFQKEIRNYLTQ